MYQKTTLNNGLRIVTAPMPHTRSVSLGFFLGIGSRYETDAQAGTSHFIEHMCFRGTTKRPTSREISEAIEGVGGILNGDTDKEITAYWSKVAQPHFRLALDVLLDILLNSKFDAEDFEKERQVILEEIRMTKDSPSQQVDLLIDGLLWPNHALGRDIAGTEESVTALTQGQVLDYQARHYRPNNAVIAIAGDIQHQEVIAAVAQALDSWTTQYPRSEYTPYVEQPSPKVRIEKRDTEQVHLCLALPGLSLFHPKRFILDLLNIVLGEGMSSRLFAEVRDRLGLAYHIHSYVEHFLDSGSITVYAGVEPKNVGVTIEAILEQLRRLKEPVPATELSKAKELAKGRLLLRLEDSRSVAAWLGGQDILTGTILNVDDVVGIIDAITAEEIKQVAEELLLGKQLRLAAVGPIASDEPLDELLKL